MRNKIEFLEFDLAKKFAISLKLKNKKEWRLYASSNKRPKNIPYHPEIIYKNNGWVNFGDWLGDYPLNSRSRSYVTFNEAKKIVHNLSFKTQKEWIAFDKNKRIDLKLPANPISVYRNEWIDWTDWLGTKNISVKKKQYLSFDEAKKFVKPLNLKGQKSYSEYVQKEGYKHKLPHSPERFYKNKGWTNTSDFLGYKSIKRELKESKFLYFYNLGNNILGYGITYQIKKRNMEHRMNAKKYGIKIEFICYFEFNDGLIAHEVEKYFRHNYPKEKTTLKCFTTENTNIKYLKEMTKYIIEKQKADN